MGIVETFSFPSVDTLAPPLSVTENQYMDLMSETVDSSGSNILKSAYDFAFKDAEAITVYENEYLGSILYKPKLPIAGLGNMLKGFITGNVDFSSFTTMAADTMSWMGKTFGSIGGFDFASIAPIVGAIGNLFGGIFGGITPDEILIKGQKKLMEGQQFIMKGINVVIDGITAIDKNLSIWGERLEDTINSGITFLEQEITATGDRVIGEIEKGVDRILDEFEFDRQIIFDFEKLYTTKLAELKNEHLQFVKNTYNEAWGFLDLHRQNLLKLAAQESYEFVKFLDFRIQQKPEEIEQVKELDGVLISVKKEIGQFEKLSTISFPIEKEDNFWWILIIIVFIISSGGYYYIQQEKSKKPKKG